MYKLEMHLHVKGTSDCAETDEKTIAELYKSHGYDGIVYTSHYNSYLAEEYYGSKTDCKKYNENFVAHYLTLKKECEKVGIDVFFGMESMPDCMSYFEPVPDKAELLIYGVTPDFVLDGGEKIFKTSHRELYELCLENGWILSQAHPFRTKINYRNPEYLNGVEAFNGHPGHSNDNEKALEFAKKYNLIETAGSDFHRPEHIGTGVFLERRPENEADLVSELKKRKHKLFTKNGEIIID